MRRLTIASLTILASAGALASCATTAPAPRSAEAQAELIRLLDGKVAGEPQSCLPAFSRQDMVVIDENTILFRDGSRRIWRAEMNGPCNGLGRPGTALVTRQFGGSSLCSGEIAQMVDTAGGFTVGSCAFGEFVPYAGPARR